MTVCEANIDFYSMQYSLLINVFVVGLGAVFFFLTAIWIVRDKIKAENPEAYKNAKNSTNPETKEMLGCTKWKFISIASLKTQPRLPA